MLSLFFVLLAGLPVLSTATPHMSKLEPAPVLTPQPLNITTLTANANKESIFECWSVADLKVSAEPGVQGALIARLAPGAALNLFNIPARFDGGLHNAPVIQWVSLLTPYHFPRSASLTRTCN